MKTGDNQDVHATDSNVNANSLSDLQHFFKCVCILWNFLLVSHTDPSFFFSASKVLFSLPLHSESWEPWNLKLGSPRRVHPLPSTWTSGPWWEEAP